MYHPGLYEIASGIWNGGEPGIMFWDNVENQYWQDLLNEHFELVMKTTRELGALYQWVGK